MPNEVVFHASADLVAHPPTPAETLLARQLLVEPNRTGELVALSGGRDRAEAIFVVEVIRYARKEYQ